ncbi:hypothetical protein I7I50_08850 [Histoplasma capsulatum G186AR]|uniref:Uncharacterized protein n=1 Tax=Ajellomyces capsulatus TaxID=5037 RepID=A0A8H7YP45_AJECA|nr:hypothetical protein I7I52_06364 [Histoplasma capsulatum]QSS73912.1 hypothetical protein I7I50_08850 [Histoplasma capsulatum G186AR]
MIRVEIDMDLRLSPHLQKCIRQWFMERGREGGGERGRWDIHPVQYTEYIGFLFAILFRQNENRGLPPQAGIH